jgi:hypothetical protein
MPSASAKREFQVEPRRGEVVTPTARMKAFERRDGLDNTTRVRAWRRVESRAL